MANKLRAPAVPLIVNNPDLSLWSFADKITDDPTRHWSGMKNNILGLIEIDGKLKRFMGVAYSDSLFPEDRFDVLNQTSYVITPMQTIYNFECSEVKLELTFTSPLFTDDLDVLSRPVSYIDYEITPNDGSNHNVKIAFMMNVEIGDSTGSKNIEIILDSSNTYTFGAGCNDVLSCSYDKGTANCGYFKFHSKDEGKSFVTNAERFDITTYTGNSNSIDNLKIENPRFVLGSSGYYASWEKEYELKNNKNIKNYICIGFDDIYAMEYFGEKAKLYCYRNGVSFEDIMKKAFDEHDDIIKKAVRDGERIINMAKTVSDKYSDIISLAYRQVIAAHKLIWCDGEMLFISKECASNGCVATVDVTYPSMPMFLMLNPKLVEAMLSPIMKFALSDEWPYDFAPHDLGMYPKANGQIYGIKNERLSASLLDDTRNKNDYVYAMQMPVEESGNMIICIAAMCKAMADYSYAEKHYLTLLSWAQYLLDCGYDPENQLCTDDFAGRLAHNCNLSIKAIVGIACFGHIAEMLGKDGSMYYERAKLYAKQWKIHASNGDHYRLTFDKEDSWSLKYNLIWDKLFGFGLFDDEIIDKEIENYKKHMTRYGVPLDNRTMWGKTDWQLWSAALKPNSDYENAAIEAMHFFLNETPSRAPFADWIVCNTGERKTFQNRTVQGGLFINLLVRDEKFSGGEKK